MVKITISVKFSAILCFLALLSGLCLSSSHIVAEGESGGGENSCTLSYSTDASHEVTMLNGNYSKDLGTSTFGAVCDDDAGFSMYAVGYSNDEYGNNKMVAMVDGIAAPEHDISSGTAVSGNTSNWAMKITAVSGDYTPTIENGFNSYSAIPDAFDKIVSYAASTDDIIGSSLQSTYAVYISGTQPAGTYAGQVKYTLIHPADEIPLQPLACEEDKICYSANTRRASGMMGEQAAAANSEKVLLASNFSRAGYGFAGWNTEYDYSGITYGPNETITTPSDMSEGLSLYAVWVKSTGNLQDWEGCYDLDVGDVTALTDLRDNQVYAVAKLADGKCWMIENLRLEAGDTTDVSDAELAQGYGTSVAYGNFVGLATAETANFDDTDPPVANSLYSPTADGNKIVIGTGDDAFERMPRYNNLNTQSRPTSPTSNSGGMYGYGNSYSWSAAMANTIYYAGANSKDADGWTSDTVNTSICPSGWKLPRGGNKAKIDLGYDDWYRLAYTTIGSDPKNYNQSETTPYWNDNGDTEGTNASKAMRAYPNNFVYSGYFEGSTTHGVGSSGYYWSSTAHSNLNAYRLSLQSTSVGAGVSADDKYMGHAVRCITPSVRNYDVEVFFDNDVTSVIFENSELGDQIVTTSGETIKLSADYGYTVSATFNAEDRGVDTWSSTENGDLSSEDGPIVVYSITGDAELSLTSKEVCPSDKICYKRNDTSTGTLSGAMGRQSISSRNVVLMASNFSNTEYGFAGWNTEPDGSGTSYGPNETIHLLEYEYNSPSYGLTLYAMWVPSAGTLQNWSCPLDSEMPIGTVTALTDFRDNQVYAVAKLADGKCWMIENMRLESEYTVGDNVNNSHYTNESLAQGYAPSTGYGAFIGLADAEQSGFSSAGGSNSIYSSDGTGIVDIEHIDAPGYRMPRYNNTNTSVPASTPVDGQTSIYSYGNYYTWHAAIADTAYYDTNNMSIDETSICPAGWGLPTGGMAYATGSTTGVNVTGNESTYRDFYNLGYKLMNNTTAYEDTPNNGQAYYDANEAFRKYPNNFVYSGIYNGSAAYNRGTQANYWASTISSYDDGAAYELYLDQNAWPGTKTELTYNGGSIRCVDKTVSVGLDGLEYMQDFADLTASEMETLKASMVEDEQYVIKDNRDEKTYYISKLADGNIWMTQDLDHDIVTTTDFYTYDNTDIGHGDVQNTAAKWTASTATYETGDTTWVDGGNGNYIPQSYDPGEVIWDGVPDTYWSTTLDNMKQGIEPHYRIGNYYDWTAAVAMNDSSNYTDEDIDQSICPAGWTLPRGRLDDNGSGTFHYLLEQYGYDDNVYQVLDPRPWDSPFYYSYGGFWRGYSDVVASFAYYWSSSVYSSTGANNLVLDPDATSIATSGGYSRSDGLNVRCIVRTPTEPPMSIDDLTYMQEFATLSSEDKADVLDSMTEGEQYQLADSRDNKVYYISKLGDGNVWMTQNLDFDIVNGGAGLDSTNTDVPANWTAVHAGKLTNTYQTNDHTWNDSIEEPESYDPGDYCWNGTIRDDFNGTISNSTSYCPQDHSHYHLGNYYNWSAAVASSDTAYDSGENVDMDQSICPAGWRLPKDSELDHNPGTFSYLIEELGLIQGQSGNLHQTPYYLSYGGNWDGSSYAVGGYGYYYTSVSYSYLDVFDFDFTRLDEMYTEIGTTGRTDGYSLRCLAR